MILLNRIFNLVTNTTVNAKINEIKNEIPSITNLATIDALIAKISEVKMKLPNITNLATPAVVTTVENKIPDRSKYTTTKLTAENFTARLKQAILANKGDIADFVINTDFDNKPKKLNKKVTSNKSKHLLVENEFKTLQNK